MRAAFVQFNPDFGKVKVNIDKAVSLIEETESDLFILPELFNTGYLFLSEQEVLNLAEVIPSGKTTKALCEVARKKNSHIIAGIAEVSQGKFYNSAVLVSPHGYIATYRKIHLFNEENLWFQPGNQGFAVHDIGPCKIGIMICFDWYYPESARILALQGADVICHPANLVLPHCQDSMITRCLENRIYAVTANRTGEEKRGAKHWQYTGKSQIIAPDGRILYRADGDSEEVGLAEIDAQLARNKRLNEFNDLFSGRRVKFYQDLVSPDDKKIKI